MNTKFELNVNHLFIIIKLLILLNIAAIISIIAHSSNSPLYGNEIAINGARVTNLTASMPCIT